MRSITSDSSVEVGCDDATCPSGGRIRELLTREGGTDKTGDNKDEIDRAVKGDDGNSGLGVR